MVSLSFHSQFSLKTPKGWRLFLPFYFGTS
jgi:hypothetical protein